VIDNNTSFGLIATEPEGLFERRRVSIKSAANVGERHDFVWAEVDPPFQPPLFAMENELSQVLLAPRRYGYSLKNLADFPLDVYICAISDAEDILASNIEPGNVRILALGLILSPSDDRGNLREIYNSIKETRGNVNYINPVHK